MKGAEAGSLIREARRRTGLSQVQLARRAGITQSVVSAYESAARQPSLPMLGRLVAASGMELEIRVLHPRNSNRLRGPLGSKIADHRNQIRKIAASHGLTNLRVFGSVARGEETEHSDIDLLVDVARGTGLLGLARCQRELQSLLGSPVDLVPADTLKPNVARWVIADTQPL